MTEDTNWLLDYEATTAETIAANQEVAGLPHHRTWPISGNGVQSWNPAGFDVLWKIPPDTIFDTSLNDERTPDLNQ